MLHAHDPASLACMGVAAGCRSRVLRNLINVFKERNLAPELCGAISLLICDGSDGPDWLAQRAIRMQVRPLVVVADGAWSATVPHYPPPPTPNVFSAGSVPRARARLVVPNACRVRCLAPLRCAWAHGKRVLPGHGCVCVCVCACVCALRAGVAVRRHCWGTPRSTA